MEFQGEKVGVEVYDSWPFHNSTDVNHFTLLYRYTHMYIVIHTDTDTI